MAKKASRAALGPGAFADLLGLADWQLTRGRREGLIPPMDRSGKWSADLVDSIKTRGFELRQRIGDVPDMGAFAAAKHLTERLGVAVQSDAVHELGRLGHLDVVEYVKDEHPVYDGRAIAAFNDLEVLATAAADGELFTGDRAANYLQIRRPDLDHLVRAGILAPTVWALNSYGRKRDGKTVALYRAADLRAVLARTDIDWEAVRATPPGKRSPLAKLPDAPKGTR
jgi:hypothetical protein